ncbi:AP-1 complex subunit mu [Aspergillus affinis]|uniref:AP-1 complex subunit mu n=1 Tax=Aspergillus affinis TaxID=1070780 RepID=UPI0022FDE22B|nr:uncharacterized protein KD926_008831 [Aspergillus affinis]KAI9045404.1 hypothetical protein KD926_008831 [Aspergillus affinis]
MVRSRALDLIGDGGTISRANRNRKDSDLRRHQRKYDGLLLLFFFDSICAALPSVWVLCASFARLLSGAAPFLLPPHEQHVRLVCFVGLSPSQSNLAQEPVPVATVQLTLRTCFPADRFYILTLLARNYRGDIPMSAVEKFPMLLSDAEEESSAVPPCFSHEGINYLYIRHSNLYILALTKKNTNATEILLFLHKLVEVFTEYFKVLEEESIRDNFVIIYELLDEMMDFGYPQTTESKILQEYITQESHKLEVQARPPIAVTNAVSWRSEGIRYRKNEVFLDVVESLNLLVSASGNVLRSEILGAVKMKCYLSGMPELRLGLNDKVMFETTGRATRGKAIEMEDVKFHQCVRLSRFENDRTISFIPPDGEFELMSYRLNTQVKPLIWVECLVESHSGSRVEYMLKAKAQFKRRSTANNVEIIVPVPEDADSPRFRTNIGTVHYAPEQSAIVWKIKQFGGGKEFLMRAELGLPSVKGDDEHGGGMTGGFGGSMGGTGSGKAKRPINVKFEIPYFTTSGIQVRYLKITEPKLQYPSLPWVRYITQSGDIAVRMPDVQ